MRTEYINIGDDDWGVLLIYGFDVDVDYDEMAAQMRSFGLSEGGIRRAMNVLSKYNTGMCVSVPDLRMSAIYVGRSTSSGEFYSTVIHECIHAANAILEWYGEDWVGEPAAYLVGYMTKAVVERVGEPCRD